MATVVTASSAPWQGIEGAAGALLVYHANPPTGAGTSGPVGSATTAGSHTLVVCHGLPVEPQAAGRTGRTFPALADRLAKESGWQVVTCCLRGVGMSEGDFSLAGWAEDLASVIAWIRAAGPTPVWLAGFGVAGSLALVLAAKDAEVRGVVTMGSPATFARWQEEPDEALAAARRVGVVRTPGFPADPAAWASAGNVDPVAAATLVAPRPILVVHGADDDVVPVADARLVADAGRPGSELRLLAGAGHRLRADPRAVALLLGWLDRQGP